MRNVPTLQGGLSGHAAPARAATAEVAAAYGLHEDGAFPVRLDAFVAWRSQSGVPDPAEPGRRGRHRAAPANLSGGEPCWLDRMSWCARIMPGPPG